MSLSVPVVTLVALRPVKPAPPPERLLAARSPATVTAPPDWLSSESVRLKPDPFHTASVPAVPLPLTAPPEPIQLPAVVQTSLPFNRKLAPVKFAGALKRATFELKRASASVPLLTLLAFRFVSSEPFSDGSWPLAFN